MSYGLKYQCTFDPLGAVEANPIYTLQFLFKGYSGATYSVKGASVPVVHSWATDDPKAPIKGSSLQITLVNEGSTPLTSFMTNEDDGVKVRFYWGTQLMFEGFLVQDDCLETLANYAHEINLSANDNLGLLKGIPLDQATLLNTLFPNISIGSILLNNTITIAGFSFTPQVGVPFTIINHPILNGTYTPLTVSPTSVGYWVTQSTFLATHAAATGDIRTSGLDLTTKLTLLQIYQYCISSTNVEITTNFYTNIYEQDQVALTPFLVQTMIDPDVFLKNDTEYYDCYTVLEYIFSRFNITLFQAKGVWNVIRWDELRYYSNAVHGFQYDIDYNFVGYLTLSELRSIEDDFIYQAQPNHRIFRPYKFDQETFNYNQPKQLLKNYTLKNLGALQSDTTVGTTRYRKYAIPANSGWRHIAGDTSYIVVETDTATDNEITRYIQQPVVNSVYPNFPSPVTSLKFNDIEVNLGDQFELSFSYRWIHNNSLFGLFNIAIFVDHCLTGTQKWYVLNDVSVSGGTYLGWSTAASSTYVDGYGGDIAILRAHADTKDDWQTVTLTGIITAPNYTLPTIINNGLLKIYMFGGNSRRANQQTGYANDDVQMRDIRFEYTPRINKSTKIIGQTHEALQAVTVKQNNLETIQMDDSPRNSIAGTLFRMTKDSCGLLQDRTVKWRRATVTESRNLGDITTFETLFWRRVPRSIIEGTLVSVGSMSEYISLLSIFNYNNFPSLNFIWGRLDIDYKNNKLTGTLWEQWDDSEVDASLTSGYQFNYLYSTT